MYGQPVPINSAKSTGVSPEHKSVAVTIGGVGIASHSTVSSLGTPVNTGKLLSSI